MENYYSNNSKSADNMFLKGNMKINTRMGNHAVSGRGRGKSFARSPTMNSYSPQYTNLLKLLRSSSPSSAIERIDPRTPMKINMKEETLVIDDVGVACSGSTPGNSHSKRATNRAEEETARSYASKFRLGRGKEEQRPSRFPLKSKSEVMALSGTEVAATIPSKGAHSGTTSTKTNCTEDWSPVVDGIEVTLPSHTGKTFSREDVNSYIQRYLYGPSAKQKRLPVFINICKQMGS